MKHHIKIILAGLLCSGSLGAQSLWQWQNPLPQGNGLSDICFIDSLRGWAVGGAGTVVRTTDGGQHWLHAQTPLHELLIRASFVSPNVGWALTYFTYKLLRTTDGGATWDSITTLPSPYYLDMRFVSESTGFASGGNGKIMRTTDGGCTWNATQTNFTGTIYTLHFASASIGWAAGPGGWALKTIDGGLTWTYMTTAGLDPSSSRVFSLDGQRAYIVGSHDFLGTVTGFLFSTANGGTTWQAKYFEQVLSDVYFSSPATGWVSDIDGVIYHTTDGGTTWTQLNGRSTQFVFAGPRRAWGITGSGLIMATEDGWQTSRSQIQAVTTWILWGVSALDSNSAVACGSNSLVVGTKDGGKSWLQYYNPGIQRYLMDIVYKSPDRILAVGEGGALVRSTDGGASWSDSTLDDPWLSGIAFATDDIGYIVGSSGTLYRTGDGGKSWSVHTTLDNTIPERIVFSSPVLGWIVADDGVYKSTNVGETWERVYAATGVPLDVAGVGNRAWFPKVNAVVYTTDAGLTWTSRTVFPVGNTIYDIRSLAFADENNGWAASNNGRIYRTTNGGDTWYMESDMNGNSLFGIRFADSKRGWAVGGGGAILHYNSVVTSVSEPGKGEVPTRIVLMQSYPNPFNPATTIRFTLFKRTTATLKVYNILGQELETLFSGTADAGEFAVQWNAEQFSSGVYFYRLQSGGYVRTMRMILVK